MSTASTSPALPAPPLRRGLALTRGLSAWTIVGCSALAVSVIASFGLVVLVSQHASLLSPPSVKGGFPGWMSGPLTGVWDGVTRDRGELSALFTVGMGILAACYAVALACARHIPPVAAIAALGCAYFLMFLAPPMPLTDVFNYIHYARMGVVHGLNPYAHLPYPGYATDPAGIFSNWHHLRSPYGPLFTLASYPLALLPVSVAFWLLKAAVGLAAAGCLKLIWSCARRLDRDPVTAMLLFGLHPALVVWAIGGDHNDVFMLLALLAAVRFMLGEREGRAGAAAVVATGIKMSAGVLLPILIAGSRRWSRTTIGIAVAGVCVAVAQLIAFGTHIPNLAQQSRVVMAWSLPNLAARAVGLGGSTAGVRTLSSVLLLVVVAGCCVAVRRGMTLVTAAGWATLALVVSMSWVLPWYICWVLPFAALSASRRLRVATLAFSLYLVIIWSPSFLLASFYSAPSATKVGQQNQAYQRSLQK